MTHLTISHSEDGDMDNLYEAHADLNAVWKFYKDYSQRQPKDDAFYEDMAETSMHIQMTTIFGNRALVAAIDAISTDDWMEKNKS